jgi:hypothetical protein
MFGGTLFFIGLAAFFFYVYGRRKALRAVPLKMNRVETGDSPVSASQARR